MLRNDGRQYHWVVEGTIPLNKIQYVVIPKFDNHNDAIFAVTYSAYILTYVFFSRGFLDSRVFFPLKKQHSGTASPAKGGSSKNRTPSVPSRYSSFSGEPSGPRWSFLLVHFLEPGNDDIVNIYLMMGI